MRVFHCDHCQHLLFFENVLCVSCSRAVAFLPDLQDMVSLEPGGDGLWRSSLTEAEGRTYRLCQNYEQHDVCNWAIPSDDPDPLCRSCRHTRVIPDLSLPANKEAWYKLEVAKRRLLYTLLDLDLPVKTKSEDPERGFAFEFLSDAEPGAEPVLTGHDGGLITLNIAEADDAERERRRIQMREPYRTLLGHFRHEIGHYYWDRLIEPSARLEEFRALFGDEREDYAAALQRHYDEGPRVGWEQQFVTAYASTHPWEDWAESWAHYLHVRDALDTAAACGVSLRPGREDEPSLKADPRRARRWRDFDVLITDWFPLTYLLNNLNRGLGLPDGYPFVLSKPALDKLRFVHETIAAGSAESALN